MSAILQHIGVVLAAWTLVGFALGLIIGPVLRDRSAAYPPMDGDA